MLLITIALLIAATVQEEDFHNSYMELFNAWNHTAIINHTFAANQYANQDEQCYDKNCQYYYYVKENPQLGIESSRNATILLISGLRGNDYLSSQLLLHAYSSNIQAAKIIFFPIANPSGYIKNIDGTFPGNFSIQSDFPLENNDKCNRSAALKILHHIYRTYRIDLTLYVHNDQPKFAYSWSKKFQEDTQNSDYGIFVDISEMVRYYSNENRIELVEKMEIGNLYQIKADGERNFVDWAFGGSKYPHILSKTCSGKQIDAYPPEMMNGLVFTVALGIYKTNDTAYKLKLIERGQIIIQKLARMTNPKMNITIKDHVIQLKIEGCKTGILTNLTLHNQKGHRIFQLSSKQIVVYGNVRFGEATSTKFTLPNINDQKFLKYSVSYMCDNGWIGKGKSLFSKIREFTQSGSVLLKKQTVTIQEKIQNEPKSQVNQVPNVQKQDSMIALQPIKSISQLSFGWLIIVIILSLIILWMIFGFRRYIKLRKLSKITTFNERFQTIEYIEEDLQDFQYSEENDNKNENEDEGKGIIRISK